MLLEAPGACGSRLTSSASFTVFTVMDNLFNQTAIRTELYEFEPCFTQEIQVAWPIQVRMSAPFTVTINSSSGTEAKKDTPAGLGTGTIIGIAFGGFFAICAVLGLVCFFLWYRRGQKKGDETRQGRDEGQSTTSQINSWIIHPQEVHSEPASAELDTYSSPQELDAVSAAPSPRFLDARTQQAAHTG